MSLSKTAVGLMLGLLSYANVYAKEAHMPPESAIQGLAQSMPWRNLLHYRASTMLGEYRYKSVADDPVFFLSKNGAEDAIKEMQTSLQQMSQVPSEPQKDGSIDAHAQCRFPARFHFLKQNFPRWANDVTTIHCPAYDEWIAQMQPASATLIFPAAYINSPSSMFGHTLLRINSNQNSKGSDILAHSISYAADMPDDVSGWEYAYGGLFGGHPGYMYEADYYDKIIEYSDLDNRDIWEYPIKLSQKELDAMLRHVWELQKVRFDYYFLDENCALRLLDILDVAKPGLNSAQQFTTHAIPADTVRALQEKGVLGKAVYRPARITKLKHELSLLNASQRDWVKRLGSDVHLSKPDIHRAIQTLGSDKEQAKVLDLSYRYLRYQVDKRRVPPKKARKRSLILLSLRSKLPKVADISPTQPVPAEQGHKTARVALGVGQIEKERFIDLKLRPAFHDILDNDAGYVMGAQINFLGIEARHYNDRHKSTLEALKLIDIKALSARDAFFKPWSWEFGVGWNRHDLRVSHKTRFGLYGAGGVTRAITPHLRLSALAKIDLNGNAHLGGKWDAAAGAEFLALFSLPEHAPKLATKVSLSAARWEFEGTNTQDRRVIGAGVNVPFRNVNNALRFEWQRVKQTSVQGQPEHDQQLLSWHYYF